MEINELRTEISNIDKEISELFDRRLDLVRRVGRYKQENDLPIKNTEVENTKIEIILSRCNSENKENQEELFRKIFDISCEVQADQLNAKENK